MSALPHGLTEPLHYAPAPAWLAWAAALLGALALAGALLLLRRRRARRDAADRPPAAPVPPPDDGGALGELARLRRLHGRAATYRQGCHELADLLRTHLEGSRRRPYSRWTAREAVRAEGDTMWTRLLGLLSDLRFARRPPSESDFDGLCELTEAALKTEVRA